ncbi:YppG family protein [Bacillus sp. S/N-304-OC-R1]|nr:YppG family protein [Bacillus sp. S/N-304-OC-R1]
MQHPYYPTPSGNMGSFNSPYYQPFSFGSENMYPNAYPNQPIQGYVPNQYPMGGYPIQQQGMQGKNNYSQSIFQNPLDPETGQQLSNSQHPYYSNSMMNPYPKQSFIPKQTSNVQSILNSFKSQDGSIDFNKMMNTAGQMMNAVNQVSTLVKGLGGIIKV